MNTRFKTYKGMLIAAVAAFAIMFAACEHNDDPTPAQERVIVYAVGHEESRTTVRNEAEWDVLLEQFCSYAQEGSDVIFYNMSTTQTPSDKAAGATTMKDVATFSTTSREEMKHWMKDMEKAGKTVSIKYDDKTGTWSGTAYVNAPAQEETSTCYSGTLALVDMPAITEPVIPGMVAALVVNTDSVLILVKDGYLSTMIEDMTDGLHVGDEATLCGALSEIEDMDGATVLVLDISEPLEGSVTGSWHLSCIAHTEMGNGTDYILSTSLIVPEADGQSINLEFLPDGTATYTVSGNNPSLQNGTWSIGNEGTLCTDLLPDGQYCWYINWLTSSTLIISREGNGNGEFYQIQFDKN